MSNVRKSQSIPRTHATHTPPGIPPQRSASHVISRMVVPPEQRPPPPPDRPDSLSQHPAKSFTEKLKRLTASLNNQAKQEESQRTYFLEPLWSDVVADHFYMSKKTRMQQQALWEMLTTERNYILKLTVVVEVFQKVISVMRSELPDVNHNMLFANIRDVLAANERLWSEFMMPVVAKSRETKQPMKASDLLGFFFEFSKHCRAYLRFSLNQDQALTYLRELIDNSDDVKREQHKKFKQCLAFCETLPQCKRFKLTDLLTEPMQRLTRYPLLLKKIKKESEDDDEKEDLETMTVNCEGFIYDINQKLRCRFEKEKLDKCLSEFEYHNCMEAGSEEIKWISVDFLHRNIQTLRVEEQRCILKRGPMKLVEKRNKNESAIEMFLFTDVIVIAKLKKATNKLQVAKQLFYLDKVKLIKSELRPQSIVFVYLDECGLLATAFILESDENVDPWIAAVEKAKVRYENAKAGHGSTLSFFNDDYTTNIPALEAVPPIKTNVIYEDEKAPSPKQLERKPMRSSSAPQRLSEEAKETSRRVSAPQRLNEEPSEILRKISAPAKPQSEQYNGATKVVEQEAHATWVLNKDGLSFSGGTPIRPRNNAAARSDSGISVRSTNSLRGSSPTDKATPSRKISEPAIRTGMNFTEGRSRTLEHRRTKAHQESTNTFPRNNTKHMYEHVDDNFEKPTVNKLYVNGSYGEDGCLETLDRNNNEPFYEPTYDRLRR